MLHLSLAFAVLGLCLLVAGVVAFHVECRTQRRGGLTFWTLMVRGRAVLGGSVYRPARAHITRRGRVIITLQQ